MFPLRWITADNPVLRWKYVNLSLLRDILQPPVRACHSLPLSPPLRNSENLCVTVNICHLHFLTESTECLLQLRKVAQRCGKKATMFVCFLRQSVHLTLNSWLLIPIDMATLKNSLLIQCVVVQARALMRFLFCALFHCFRLHCIRLQSLRGSFEYFAYWVAVLRPVPVLGPSSSSTVQLARHIIYS